ncbi:MAG: site-specific integrase, partial [Proteobacteria bacterium]
MPQATFVLKEPTSEEETLVYMLYRFNGAKLKYSTGQKINPKYWNPQSQRAREVRGFKHQEFNGVLNNLQAEVNEAYRTLLNDRKAVTPDLLRVSLNVFLQKHDTASSKDLISFAEYIVESTDRSKGTKKQLKQAIRNLQEFKFFSKRSMHFDSIDLDFYDEFVDFLIKKNYGKNTIGTLIKNLKVFMNEAVDRKLTQNLQFKNKRFKTVEEPTENIYLTEKELKRLYGLDLSDNTRLEKVRDLFIIGCYTGLRFSDLSQLSIESIQKGKRVIKVRTQKTDEIVVIPIGSIVGRLIDKYEGRFPVLRNDTMNKHLKEIGQKAGFREPVEIIYTKGGVRQREVYQKWELLTMHTARRSFATNAYLESVPTISIMKITG